jgi:transcriptional regulator GlxA family with amidase domain
VSVCTGTFFLAAAGLLDGRRAATHWRYVERLRQFRPQVDVDPEAIYLRDGNVWTSAGVTAGIDLALALIEADFGRTIALAVARRHVVFRIRPGGQGQFSPELAAQGIRHHRLSKLAENIAEGPQEDWRTDTLAAEAGVSPRSLSRLFRKELNASPSQFVERVRIDQARRALLETEAKIENVAIRCGFGSLRRMDRAFSRAISATPTEFRARFKAAGAPG